MILVSGGAGYVGSVLVRDLLRIGESVRVVDPQWFGNSLQPHSRLEIVRAEIDDLNAAALANVDSVCHLSGLSNDPTAEFMPELALESNVWSTRRLALALAEESERRQREIRFLFASSCSVYYSLNRAENGNVDRMTEEAHVAPGSTYSKSKRLAEIELLRIAERYPLFCPVLLRKGTIFGISPRMRFDLVVNAFTLNAWRKQVLTVNGSGEAWRPLVHIQDVVDAYIYLLSAPRSSVRGEVFNLLHKNYRVLELAHWVVEILQEHRGVSIRVQRDRSASDGARSYYVDGHKLASRLGFRAERGATSAVLEIWDALEQGQFGSEPERNDAYFNIRSLRSHGNAPKVKGAGS